MQEKIILEGDCLNIIDEMANIMKQLGEDDDNVQDAKVLLSLTKAKNAEDDDTIDNDCIKSGGSIITDSGQKDRSQSRSVIKEEPSKKNNDLILGSGQKKEVDVVTNLEEAIHSDEVDSDDDMFGPSQPAPPHTHSCKKAQTGKRLMAGVFGKAKYMPSEEDGNLDTCDVIIPDSAKDAHDSAVLDVDDEELLIDTVAMSLPLSCTSAVVPLSPSPPPPLPLAKFATPETVRLPTECAVMEKVKQELKSPRTRLSATKKVCPTRNDGLRSQPKRDSPKSSGTSQEKTNIGCQPNRSHNGSMTISPKIVAKHLSRPSPCSTSEFQKACGENSVKNKPAREKCTTETDAFPRHPEWLFVTTGLSKTLHTVSCCKIY